MLLGLSCLLASTLCVVQSIFSILTSGPNFGVHYYFGTGHTTGDIVVYFPEAKTAFLGDQFFGTRPQLIHAYKGGNAFAHVVTLEKMKR